jgi:hypothetical protein
VRLEVLGKFKKKNHRIGYRIRNLPVCSSALTTTLPRAPEIVLVQQKMLLICTLKLETVRASENGLIYTRRTKSYSKECDNITSQAL